MTIETIADYKDKIESELALFDTLKVILGFVDEQADHLETVVTSKMQKKLDYDFVQLRHLIWASENLLDSYVSKIRNLVEN